MYQWCTVSRLKCDCSQQSKTKTVAPSSDHYCTFIVVPSSDHRYINSTVEPLLYDHPHNHIGVVV